MSDNECLADAIAASRRSWEAAPSGPPVLLAVIPAAELDALRTDAGRVCFRGVYEGDSDIVVRAEGSRLVIELSYEQKGQRHVQARAEMDATHLAIAMDNAIICGHSLSLAVTEP